VALEGWEHDNPDAYRGGGIGVVLIPENGYVGGDLDGCVNPVTGHIAAWATEIISELATYTELSPSGTGLRFFAAGTLPPRGRRKGAIEIYTDRRYLTLTGWHLEESPVTIEPRQTQLDNLWCRLFGPQIGDTVWTVRENGDIQNAQPFTIAAIAPAPSGELYAQFIETSTGHPLMRCEKTPAPQSTTLPWLLDDGDVVRRIKHASNSARVAALAQGDWTQNYASQSEADLAMCCHLAFWSRDAAQIDRLFRSTALLRDKWDEKRGAQTYGERTIAEALARQTAHYTPLPTMTISASGTAPVYVWGASALQEVDFLPSAPWPELGGDALYGLAGTFVSAVKPYTETDPVALLFQFLMMFGSLVGRTPHAIVEADWHHLNLFGALVGETSKGRKGVSYGHARRLMSSVDAAWAQTRIMSGLASGEGLIWNVRDAIYGHNKKGEEVCIDAGVDDKRLFVFEPELARLLRVLGREGNTLSAVIRHAWDDGALQTMVSGRRVAPVSATNAFVSILGHITADELRRNLTETETSNGFANRFLWCCVRRAQLLPEGGRYPENDLQPLVDKLKQSVISARKTGTIGRDTQARKRWAEVYERLSEGKSGLLGHVTARAEAQVLRLSCLYALLDQSDTVTIDHLNAALAFWRYCEDSAVYIFGDALGDAVADEILHMLRAIAPNSMTRTDIYNAFDRHKTSANIQQALAVLLRQQLVTYAKEDTPGRPVERWSARLVSASAYAQKAY
jgi:hypothetical protein